MKLETKKLAKGFTLVELLVVIAIIAALAALATPVVLKQQKKAASTQAINNAKQIYLLLFEYDQDSGKYPEEGTDSNTNFLAFYTGGYTDSEEIFYAKTAWNQKPDTDVSSTTFCATDETGFTYVEGLSTGASTNVALLGAPQLTKNTASTFDPDPYGGNAVVLKNDGGVRTYRIKADNTVEDNATDGDLFADTLTGGTAVPAN